MIKIYAEIIGTMILVFLGNGVVANLVLNKTKGHGNGGWLTITIGWALAVFIGILVSYPYSGGHLNPSITIGLAIVGKFNWKLVPSYIVSQFIGSMLGSLLVWILYKDHFLETKKEQDKLSVFATVPSIKKFYSNFLSEILVTFIFIFLNLYLSEKIIFFQEGKSPILVAVLSSLVLLAIGLSLGGTTGYAMNPARDLGPRIIYTLLPIPGKVKRHWNYSLIPGLGPIFGSCFASILYLFLSS
ncbi:MIP/aquaporin family protein [Blattabacterium cuenoti]|uniref:MIP/aquaporin family protein n=1 Tax=Blattabacterium cuenoti TaxID=1653831 RepID=UPI00163B9C44|nr:MIP/aquaporin family protein [Blattabacterium cuenoti]